MKAFTTDHFVLPLPEQHRFPMAKYRLLRQRVAEIAAAWGVQLVEAPAASDVELLRAHDFDYIRRTTEGKLTPDEVKRIGFPWSPELVERSRRSTGATLAAARAALVDGVAVNLAGGTHHAQRGDGEGFCVFNDTAVASLSLLNERLIVQAAVIDLDVHQGNGTAAILSHEPRVLTCSLHGEKNFPLRKSPSDLDIELPDGCGDSEYLAAVEDALVLIADRCTPQIVFYIAGADPFEGDRLGRLKITKSGLRQRDEMVLQWCRQRKVAVAICMGGGYASDVADIVDIHAATIETAARFAVHSG